MGQKPLATVLKNDAFLIQPGDVKKEDASKQLARKFKVREEALLSVLPGDVATV